MKKRLLAALLCCTLLTGCAPRRTEPADTEQKAEGEVIAYVPLDDRPDNVERVVYLAESLGYTLKMPEADAYRTRLRGQPLNSNGTQFGDRGELYEWVMEQEAAGCDRFILSLDQILSGGLVNSRSMADHQSLTLSDGTVLTELEVLEKLLSTLGQDPDNRVWLLESIMRLAPTVGYDHWDLDGYNALRAYGMEGRPVLAGESLDLAHIQADYRLGRNGETLDLAAFDLEEWEVAEYLFARSRKLELSDRMMELAGGEGEEHFRILIGIDDSSKEDSIQKNEIAYLRTLLREGDAILSGVDDLAFKAVTRLYLEEHGWQGAAACVEYFGGTEKLPACAYDYQPLEKIVFEHFDFFDLTPVEAEEAEVSVLVLTQPADEAQKHAYCDALIQRLQENRSAGLPTILIDAGNGAYGTVFQQALTERTELGWLLSYAGFLDMAIVTGTALSHGVARYALLQNGGQTEATERAFARTLADSILKDFCYKNVVREELLTYVREELGGSPDNFWTPEIDREAVLQRLERGMDQAAAEVIENLERSNMIAALPAAAPDAERGWGGIALENYRFPWDRAFEIGMDIRLGAFTKPHKQVMGVYYQ